VIVVRVAASGTDVGQDAGKHRPQAAKAGTPFLNGGFLMAIGFAQPRIQQGATGFLDQIGERCIWNRASDARLST
jgi:hypothetical protein